MPRAARRRPEAQGMVRILYAEDNPDNVYMLSRRLQRKGFEVIIAADGAEAVTMAQTGAPALILMDLSLPVLDGWEATRRLKADPATRGMPVIALRARAMAGQSGHESGREKVGQYSVDVGGCDYFK